MSLFIFSIYKITLTEKRFCKSAWQPSNMELLAHGFLLSCSVICEPLVASKCSVEPAWLFSRLQTAGYVPHFSMHFCSVTHAERSRAPYGKSFLWWVAEGKAGRTCNVLPDLCYETVLCHFHWTNKSHDQNNGL